MTYETTSLCDDDIVEVYLRGVANFGFGQAEAYHAGLISMFQLIAANPRLARRRTEFDPPVRIHPYRAHMIVYLDRDESILIIRVLHGRQDKERHLRPFLIKA